MSIFRGWRTLKVSNPIKPSLGWCSYWVYLKKYAQETVMKLNFLKLIPCIVDFIAGTKEGFVKNIISSRCRTGLCMMVGFLLLVLLAVILKDLQNILIAIGLFGMCFSLGIILLDDTEHSGREDFF